jgi:beta-phosphoglucomutase-like phosphatase (HAD superfamily)
MNIFFNFEAVLFDYDGIIVNPELNIRAWIIACKKFGFNLNRLDWFVNEGLSSESLAKIFINKYRISNIKPIQLANEKQYQYSLIVNDPLNKIDIYPGVIETLEFLKSKNFKIGLVTGSSLERIKLSIPNLLHYFSVILTSDTLDKNKLPVGNKSTSIPWIWVMNKLETTSKKCIIIENATMGIVSGKLSGAAVIALSTTLDSNVLYNSGADFVFSDHFKLLSFFNKNL